MLNSSPPFGLPEAVHAKICQVFAGFPKISRVIIYGSRATGNFRPNSDIDLTIASENTAFDEFVKLSESLDNLMLPWKIDLSILAQIDNPALVKDIHNTGKTFYQKDEAA